MESMGNALSKRNYYARKVEQLVMRECHIVWYYLEVICWWLHVMVLRTCDGLLSWLRLCICCDNARWVGCWQYNVVWCFIWLAYPWMFVVVASTCDDHMTNVIESRVTLQMMLIWLNTSEEFGDCIGKNILNDFFISNIFGTILF